MKTKLYIFTLIIIYVIRVILGFFKKNKLSKDIGTIITVKHFNFLLGITVENSFFFVIRFKASMTEVIIL